MKIRKTWLFATVLTVAIALYAFALADVPINDSTFPDDVFQSYVGSHFDTDGDSILSDSEIAAVTKIDCYRSGISDLTGIEHFSSLKELWCGYNSLTNLNISQNRLLTKLYCYNNKLQNLDLSNNTALQDLNCSDNTLSSLDVTKNPALTYIAVDGNLLKELNVSQNTEVFELRCNNNLLTGINLSTNTKLDVLFTEGNQIEKLDISNCPNLKKLVQTADRETWYEDSNVYIWKIPYASNPDVNEYELRIDKKTSLITNSGNPPAGAIAINDTNFPDNIFQSYVGSEFDKDGDGYLSVEEIAAVTTINCDEMGISDLTGVEHFKSLKVLWCLGNQLTHLNISQNTALQQLYCSDNKLASLDISRNTALTDFNCGENQLTKLDVSKNTALDYIGCENNKLKSIDVSKNTKLEEFRCYGNQLTSLNISSNTKLKRLLAENNKLTKLDISKCPPLMNLVKNAEKQTWSENPNVSIWSIPFADRPDLNEYELRVDKNTDVITEASESYNLKDSKISGIKDQVYTGKAVQPSVTVTYNGKNLKKGTDYTVTFKNNIKVGKATVTINGKGKYKGSKSATFLIVPKSVKLSSLTAGKKQLTVKWQKGSDIDGYEIEYSLNKDFKDSKKVNITKAGSTSTVLKKLLKGKTYYVRIRTFKKAGGKKYYSAWSKALSKKTK